MNQQKLEQLTEQAYKRLLDQGALTVKDENITITGKDQQFFWSEFLTGLRKNYENFMTDNEQVELLVLAAILSYGDVKNA